MFEVALSIGGFFCTTTVGKSSQNPFFGQTLYETIHIQPNTNARDRATAVVHTQTAAIVKRGSPI